MEYKLYYLDEVATSSREAKICSGELDYDAEVTADSPKEAVEQDLNDNLYQLDSPSAGVHGCLDTEGNITFHAWKYELVTILEVS